VARQSTKSVTVRLPESVYQEAQEIVGATGKTFNELFVSGVREALKDEKKRGGEALSAAIESIRAYRSTVMT